MEWITFQKKIKEPLHTIHQRLENIVRITNLAQFNYLSFYHLDAKFVDSATKIARREAENRGLTVLPVDDERQLQHIQISLLHSTEHILVILHVPTVEKKEVIGVYNAIPVLTPAPKYHPVSRGKSSVIFPVLDPRALLAITADNIRYSVFNDPNMECYIMYQHKFCRGFPSLETGSEESCLSSLYTNHSLGAGNHCDFRIGFGRETVNYQISSTEHIFVTNELIFAPIHCSFKHNYNLQTLILNQTSRVTIPEGCGIELPTRSIWPMSNFPNSAIQVSSIKLVLNTPLPVSQLELALSYLDIINSYIWMINILMLKGFVMLFVLSLPGILYLKYTDYFRDPDAAAQNFTMVSRRCRG